MQLAILASENQVCAAASDLSRVLRAIPGHGDQRRALCRTEDCAGVSLRLWIGRSSSRQPVGAQAQGIVELVEADLVHAQRVDANHEADSLGCESGRIRHGLPGSVTVARIQHLPGPLLERHRDPKVPSYLHLLSIGSANQELAGCQRADGFGEDLHPI